MEKKPTKTRLKDRRRRRTYVSFAGAVVLILLAIGGVAYAVRLPSVTISTVVVDGVQRGDVDRIKEAVNTVLDGTYMLVVPKRLTYAVPQGSLTASLIQTFPEVAGVTVERAGQKLNVHILEREPKALWCVGGGSCYVMDAYGFIFDTAKGTTGLRIYHGRVDSPIGSTYLAGGFHDFDTLLDRLEGATKRHIIDVRVDPNDDVFAQFAEGGELRFVRTTDTEVLVQTVSSIVSSAAFQNKKALDYIELRFANKAVAKFKN